MMRLFRLRRKKLFLFAIDRSVAVPFTPELKHELQSFAAGSVVWSLRKNLQLEKEPVQIDITAKAQNTLKNTALVWRYLNA